MYQACETQTPIPTPIVILRKNLLLRRHSKSSQLFCHRVCLTLSSHLPEHQQWSCCSIQISLCNPHTEKLSWKMHIKVTSFNIRIKAAWLCINLANAANHTTQYNSHVRKRSGKRIPRSASHASWLLSKKFILVSLFSSLSARYSSLTRSKRLESTHNSKNSENAQHRQSDSLPCCPPFSQISSSDRALDLENAQNSKICEHTSQLSDWKSIMKLLENSSIETRLIAP